ncbi:hypothetical protein Fmac_025712 [Flemingia macrophylla]|uniref:Uncharacterized protein n=1 Tax=Flemingia macrophylla TaxID=520843 RepID=A0ABD1LT34_9FABA
MENTKSTYTGQCNVCIIGLLLSFVQGVDGGGNRVDLLFIGLHINLGAEMVQ